MTHGWGGGNVPDEGGPKFLFERGILREVFITPSFFHPPLFSLKNLWVFCENLRWGTRSVPLKGPLNFQ